MLLDGPGTKAVTSSSIPVCSRMDAWDAAFQKERRTRDVTLAVVDQGPGVFHDHPAGLFDVPDRVKRQPPRAWSEGRSYRQDGEEVGDIGAVTTYFPR